MDTAEAMQLRDDAKYYAFALATTREAKEELRLMLLGRLTDVVRAEATLRGRCRDTDVRAATRVRPWSY